MLILPYFYQGHIAIHRTRVDLAQGHPEGHIVEIIEGVKVTVGGRGTGLNIAQTG